MGLPLPPKAERRGFVEVHAEAMAEMEQDRDAGRRLVEELATEARPLTDKDDALLTFEANRLVRARDKAEAEFDKDPSDVNRLRVEKIQQEYSDTQNVLAKSKTATARGLNALKMMVARDYSLAAMEHAAAKAKGDNLSTEESAEVKRLQKELEGTRKALDEANTKREVAEAQAALDKAVGGLVKKSKRGKRKKARAAEVEQTRQELNEILERMGKRSRNKAAALVDPQFLVDTALAAGKLIKLGVLKFEDFSAHMVSKFGDDIKPYLKPAWEQARKEHAKGLAEPMKARAQAGEPLSASARDIQKVAESLVTQGITEREALVDAVHEVIKEAYPTTTRREAMDAVSGLGVFRKLSKEEAKVKLREMKGEMRAVGKLEDLMQGKRPPKTGFEARKPTQQELKLSDKAAALAKKLGFDVRKKTVRWKVGTTNEDQVAAKRLEGKLKAAKTRIQKTITDLEERMAAKDFGPRPKPAPMKLDAEATKLRAKEAQTKRKFEQMQKKFERANRSRLRNIFDLAWDVTAHVPMGLVFTYDLWPIFRQAAKVAVPDIVFNPARLAKFASKSLAAGFSRAKAAEIDAQIRSGDLYEMAQEGKVDLPEFEEEMTSELIKKIPFVKGFSRLYNTFMNLYRMSQFARAVNLSMTGNKKELLAIGNAVNVFTGRGGISHQKVATVMNALTGVLSSPRLLLSQIQFMLGQPLYGGTAKTRKIIAVKFYGRTIAGYAAIYSLVKLFSKITDDDEVDVDWTWNSSDYGKIKVGEKRYDILGGISQIVTLAGRIKTGETVDAEGKVKIIRGPKKKAIDNSVSDYAKEFVRFKLAPTWSSVYDVAEGTQVDRDDRGRPLPTTTGSVLRKMFVPITIQDIYRDAGKYGVDEMMVDRILSAIGMGVRDYENRK